MHHNLTGRTDLAVFSSHWLLLAGVTLLLLLGTKSAADDNTADRLTEEEWQALHAKADALAAKGAKGIEELAKELRVVASSREWKVAALAALQRLGPDSEPALASIAPLVQSKDLRLKRQAIVTLKAIGPKAKSTIPALIQAAKETADFDGSFTFGGASNVAEAALEAVQTIDASAMPQLAEAMIPALLDVVKRGKKWAPSNALSLLRQLGPHVKPALPKLKELLPDMLKQSLREVARVFRAGGEEGLAMLADFILDPKTTSEIRVALLDGYRWEKRTTPATIRMLRALLDDRDAKVRVAALKVTEYVRAKELIPAMIDLLEDTDLLGVASDLKGDDEYHVARALGNQGREAVPLLVKALGRRFHLVRYQAARALGQIGKEAQEAVPALENVLQDPQPVIQVEAAKAILKSGKVNDKALQQMEKLLQQPRLSGMTLKALGDTGRSGRPLFPAVKKLVLETKELGIQSLGFQAIKAMQADPPQIVQIWAAVLKKSDVFLESAPIEHIRAHGKEALGALPNLLEGLEKGNLYVRRRSTEILAAMGPAAEKAIPKLIKALDEESSFVADGAMEALGAMGSLAKPAVGPLLRKFEKIKDSDRGADYRKREIFRALEQIGPGAVEAVPRLIELLPKTPFATRVLARIGPEAKVAVPQLQKLYEKESGYRKCWCAVALVKITRKTDPYVPALMEVFQKSKHEEHRAAAFEALVDLGPDARSALPVFLTAVKVKETIPPSLRAPGFGPGSGGHQREAARALAQFGPEAKGAVPHLIDMLKNSYYEAQIAAAETLGAIGPAAREAVPALRNMAEKDGRFLPIVEKALKKIEAK